jgi:hypothetical protein
MSRPVTEVVTLNLQPGANAEEAIKGFNTVLSRREGFQSLRWGRWEQDQNKVNLIIGKFPNLQSHRNRMHTFLPGT